MNIKDNAGPLFWKRPGAMFAVQAAGLVAAGWVCRQALNPDGIAYMQIASRYAQGRMDGAISGYWGPLISWLMAPLIFAGLAPLATARVVMGISAMVFLLGCQRIICRGELNCRVAWSGLWALAVVSVLWSVEVITPDLLAGGIVLFALGGMLEKEWPTHSGQAFCGGLLWGLAFLGKAVALPLGVLTSLGMAVLWWNKKPEARRQIARSLCLNFAGIALVASPWIAALSWHYAKFTVSTSAIYNHAILSPLSPKPIHIMDDGFRKPASGQITIWEDPSLAKADWSPLASWENAVHQARIIGSHVPVEMAMLTWISLVFPLVALAWLARGGKLQMNADGETSRGWFLWPVAALSLIYLPNYLSLADERYFYVAAPLGFVAAAGMLAHDPLFRRPWIQRHAGLWLALALVVPAFVRWTLYVAPTRTAGQCAHTLARKIIQADLRGPVAGSGRLPGGRAGLYTAYLTGQQWFGDKASPNAADFEASGAGLIIVNRGSGIARELERDAAFRNLDGQLFKPHEAGIFPLEVFGRRETTR
jgi:hypothetical protein